jgi:hypothetical protein
MKKAEVEVGGVYLAKVSGVLTLVRIDAETSGCGLRSRRTWWLRGYGKKPLDTQRSPC